MNYAGFPYCKLKVGFSKNYKCFHFMLLSLKTPYLSEQINYSTRHCIDHELCTLIIDSHFFRKNDIRRLAAPLSSCTHFDGRKFNSDAKKAAIAYAIENCGGMDFADADALHSMLFDYQFQREMQHPITKISKLFSRFRSIRIAGSRKPFGATLLLMGLPVSRTPSHDPTAPAKGPDHPVAPGQVSPLRPWTENWRAGCVRV